MTKITSDDFFHQNYVWKWRHEAIFFSFIFNDFSAALCNKYDWNFSHAAKSNEANRIVRLTSFLFLSPFFSLFFESLLESILVPVLLPSTCRRFTKLSVPSGSLRTSVWFRKLVIYRVSINGNKFLPAVTVNLL